MISLLCGFVKEGTYYLMGCIKDVPTPRGDNYTEWRKKVDLCRGGLGSHSQSDQKIQSEMTRIMMLHGRIKGG
jgi:hypothetical protein